MLSFKLQSDVENLLNLVHLEGFWLDNPTNSAKIMMNLPIVNRNETIFHTPSLKIPLSLRKTFDHKLCNTKI